MEGHVCWSGNPVLLISISHCIKHNSDFRLPPSSSLRLPMWQTSKVCRAGCGTFYCIACIAGKAQRYCSPKCGLSEINHLACVGSQIEAMVQENCCRAWVVFGEGPCLVKVIAMGSCYSDEVSSWYPDASFKPIFWALNYGIEKLLKICIFQKIHLTARSYWTPCIFWPSSVILFREVYVLNTTKSWKSSMTQLWTVTVSGLERWRDKPPSPPLLGIR